MVVGPVEEGGRVGLGAGFLEQAIAFLDANRDFAGVGGMVVENNLDSLEFRARVERGSVHMKPGPVDRLDGGGLYRRTALQQVGYMSDRNLHSYEEFDLAVRLRARGWRLQRIDVPSIDHFGHDISAYTLLARRWRSRYINGSGEVVRAALGQPHAGLLFRELRELRIYLAMCAWLVIGLLLSAFQPTLARALGALIVVLGLPWLAYAWQKGSPQKATYAYASLLANLGGLWRGLAARRVAPGQPVAARVLQRP